MNQKFQLLQSYMFAKVVYILKIYNKNINNNECYWFFIYFFKNISMFIRLFSFIFFNLIKKGLQMANIHESGLGIKILHCVLCLLMP